MQMWRAVVWVSLALLTLACAVGPGGAASAQPVKDAEAATHGFEAARYEVKGTYPFPGCKLIQFELSVLSHFSYLLVSGKEAWVIDPGRDVAAYQEATEKERVSITAVWLTHSHADFVAGHTELASRLNIPIYVNRKTAPGYAAKLLEEGDRQSVGDVTLEFLETPGHTPDGMCALLYGRQSPNKPLALFSGDTLFIGSVGRPDLLGEDMSAATLASMMFDTWTQKLSKLPDDVMIFPAHGAGSLCGAHLSDAPTSTLGEQRVSNPYLAHKSRGAFVAAVLQGLPEAPQYFQHNAKLNHDGPPLVDWAPKQLPWIEPQKELATEAGCALVDVRDVKEYAAGHIPNSLAIGIRGRFETWVGIMVPWKSRLVLVGGQKDLREALLRLHRIGYQAELLDITTWKGANLPVVRGEMIPPQELYAQMQAVDSPQVLDVRLPEEWMGLRIGNVINIPLSELSHKAGQLDRTMRVVAVCNSAYRSTMALGILERHGFSRAASLEGGSEAWIAAGLPVFEASPQAAPGGGARHELRLAERLSAAELKRLLLDLPGTFQLVDIRPREHYADYHLPGSENVELADLLGNPAYLTGAGPLVLVDRDGSLAMMAAGILSQKTQRPVKALYGGLAAYWSETELTSASPPAHVPRPAVHAAPSSSPAAATPAAPMLPPARPKKRSAGC